MGDFWVNVAAYGVTLVGLLVHAHWRRPMFVARFPRDHLWVAVRLVVPFALIGGLIHSLGVSAWQGYGVLLLIVVVILGTWSWGGYDDLLVIVGGYLFYQWVFFFPDRDRLILSGSTGEIGEEKRSAKMDGIVGGRGVAVTPLRSGGKIRVEGVDYEARCEHGMIEAGEGVEVVGEEAFGLVVRRGGKGGEGDR